MAASRQIVEETVDALLQQQLVSNSFRVIDRIDKRALVVPGTKAAYSAIRAAILGTIPMDRQTSDFSAIVENLAREFGVAKHIFDAKLACLPRDDPSVDARLHLVMLLSALREHWQNEAYEDVITEIREIVQKRGCNEARTSRDELNNVLSSKFGPAFSHLVNIYVVRLWGRITGTPVKIRSARLTILNSLAASVVKAVQNIDRDAEKSNKVMKVAHPPPGPPRSRLPR